jgi:hypothetical protein
MSRRFERLSGNAEAVIVGAVVLLIALAYLASLMTGAD